MFDHNGAFDSQEQLLSPKQCRNIGNKDHDQLNSEKVFVGMDSDDINHTSYTKEFSQ